MKHVFVNEIIVYTSHFSILNAASQRDYSQKVTTFQNTKHLVR